MASPKISLQVVPDTLPAAVHPGETLKRLMDVTLAAGALVALSPLLAAAALAIRVDSPGPILFKQMRVGQHRQLFQMYKFRTMYKGTPELPTDQLAAHGSPITRVGRFLRMSSIDELPQLINVLLGQMSLIGPRPVLYNHQSILELRDAWGIHVCRPGITGLAQVNGRDDLDDDTKVHLDRRYLHERCLWLDVKILLQTVRVVLTRRGAN